MMVVQTLSYQVSLLIENEMGARGFRKSLMSIFLGQFVQQLKQGVKIYKGEEIHESFWI